MSDPDRTRPPGRIRRALFLRCLVPGCRRWRGRLSCYGVCRPHRRDELEAVERFEAARPIAADEARTWLGYVERHSFDLGADGGAEPLVLHVTVRDRRLRVTARVRPPYSLLVEDLDLWSRAEQWSSHPDSTDR